MDQDYGWVIASMTVSQFKQFKRALRVLQVTGIHYTDAIRLLCDANLRVRSERESRPRELTTHR